MLCERPQPGWRCSTFLPHSLPDQECGSQPLLSSLPVSSQSLRNMMLFSVFLPNLFLSFHLCFRPGRGLVQLTLTGLMCSWRGSVGLCPLLQYWSMCVMGTARSPEPWISPWSSNRGAAWPSRGLRTWFQCFGFLLLWLGNALWLNDFNISCFFFWEQRVLILLGIADVQYYMFQVYNTVIHNF